MFGPEGESPGGRHVHVAWGGCIGNAGGCVWPKADSVSERIMLTFDEMLTLASESLSLIFRGVEFAVEEAVVFFGPTSPRLGRVDFAAALGFSHGFFLGTGSSAGGGLAAGTPHFGVAGAPAGAGAASSFLAAAAPHLGFAFGVSGSGVALPPPRPQVLV